MADIADLAPADRDTHFLRRSFEVARRAMAHGNHPFGAILVDDTGEVLIEAENGYMPARDGTAHAERLLATEDAAQSSELAAYQQLVDGRIGAALLLVA